MSNIALYTNNAVLKKFLEIEITFLSKKDIFLDLFFIEFNAIKKKNFKKEEIDHVYYTWIREE